MNNLKAYRLQTQSHDQWMQLLVKLIYIYILQYHIVLHKHVKLFCVTKKFKAYFLQDF